MNNFEFGTKAETLKSLSGRLKSAIVDELYYFPVREWNKESGRMLECISRAMQHCHYLAVRSSAQCEDGRLVSMAGAFHSCLGVDGFNKDEVRKAIEKVIGSFSGNPNDQILIQRMVANIAVSGVIMTRNLEDGAPYYVFNYDDSSGKTDSVTGGTGVHKTVLVYRRCDESHIESPRVRKMLKLARELEDICGGAPLDIEFGIMHDGTMHLFQTRPITVSQKWHGNIEKRVSDALPDIEAFVREGSLPRTGLAGRRTIFGTMPDWNPAEMIGITPRPLAASLYKELITDTVWRLAREQMGYRALREEELMVLIGGRPYIDVRSSFNSFLPRGLEESIAEKLIEAWINRLDQHPELHDKVEFEIAQTCIDFMFEENLSSRYGGLLSPGEKRSFREALLLLSRRCLNLSPSGTLRRSLGLIDDLAKRQLARGETRAQAGSGTEVLRWSLDLLDECKKSGTLPFAIIARHAFIAESILRSAVAKDAIAAERIQAFKMSLGTVAHTLASDMADVSCGKMKRKLFIKRYGHLRPGTYDITSFRYADRGDLFEDCFSPALKFNTGLFALTTQEKYAIDELLGEAGLSGIEAEGLLEYAKLAITGREYAKFIFTKNISDALEGLVRWGVLFNLSRDDLALLDLKVITETVTNSVSKEASSYFSRHIKESESRVNLSKELKLSYIIRGVRDVYVVPVHRSAPNFIGSARIEGRITAVDAATPPHTPLSGKIVCIENADPGFDWVFTRGIKALITKFGGANSHMAIRCLELGLPAAIGCGEDAFERVVKAGMVELNCAQKALRPLYGG